MKKHSFKKIIATTLAGLMLIGAAPAAGIAGLELPSFDFASLKASAAEPVVYEDTTQGLKFTIDDGVTITGFTDRLAVSSNGSYTIPTYVSNGTSYRVIKIANEAFKGCSKIKMLTIPANITSIGRCAFQNCSALTKVYFNSNSCEMPDAIYGNSYWDYSAFKYCNSLTSFEFGSNVTTIPAKILMEVTSINEVIFKGSVTKIGDYAFAGCTGIKNVDLTKVTEIGMCAFGICSSLENVVLTTATSIIGESAFNGCSKITSLTIPANVKSIGRCAFQNCSALTKVYFNSNSCEMPDAAYGNSYWDYSAFKYCNSLTSFEFGSNVTTIPAKILMEVTSINEVIFKGSVTKIGDYAFAGCTGIKNVDLTKVTEIGNYAFADCTSYESPTFSNGLIKIYSYAFLNCSNIVQVNFPSRLTTIGESAFNGCSGIKTLTIPANITSIGRCAFQNCSALTKVYFNSNSCEMPDAAYGNSYWDYSAFKYCNSLTSFEFGSNVTTIPAKILMEVTSINEVIFKGSVTKIGDYAFAGCTGIFDIYYTGNQNNWNSMTVGSNNEIINDSENYNRFDGTYTHAWYHLEAATSYTLTYNANGGSGAPSAQTGNGSITLSTVRPTRSGYTFLGWATSSNATSAQYQPGAGYNLSGNITFYAVWQKNAVTSYTLTYNANGGSNAPSAQTGNGSITLSTVRPTRSGYTFLGWATSSSATSAQYQPGAGYNLSGNITFYAVWQKNAVTSYALTYNANGGSGAPSAQTGNGSITLSTVRPTRSGYTFLGWATSSNATSAQYQPGAGYNLLSNTTLYAVWQKNIPENPTKDARINMRSSAEVTYRSIVTITATASDVPEGYYLAICEGSSIVKRGDNRSVSYYVGEMTMSRVFSVKIIDGNGKVQTDSTGSPLVAVCEVRVNSSFFARIIAFFQGLFGLLPKEKI